MCRPGVAGLPWLPLSVSAGEAEFASGSNPGASPLELELLLELLASGPKPAPGFTSPGNGKSFFAAGVAVASEESGARGTPLKLGAAVAGVGDVPTLPASPGNGNLFDAAGLFAGVGVVPQGSGCGATEQGAGSDGGEVCAPLHDAVHAITTSINPKCLSSRISSTLV